MAGKQQAGWVAARMARIERWSRGRRIGMSLLFALVLTVVIFLMLGFVVDPVNNSRGVTWVALISGVALYVAAWVSLVGFGSPRDRWIATPAAVWIVALTVVGAVVMVLLLVVAAVELL